MIMKKQLAFIICLFLMLSITSCTTAGATNRVLGDVNGDGIVDIKDVTCIQNHLAHLDIIPQESLSYGMVSGGKELSVNDATLVQKRIAEIISKFPVEDASEAMLSMTINGNPVSVEWENNEAVSALKEAVSNKPITINMSMYGGFEQVGSIGINLPRNDKRITTTAGDIVLYSGNQMVVFYGSNTWEYTRLGHIADKSVSQLKELLSKGNVEIILSY